MKTTYRTHTCGQLRAENGGEDVALCGWVQTVRSQGGVLFVLVGFGILSFYSVIMGWTGRLLLDFVRTRVG